MSQEMHAAVRWVGQRDGFSGVVSIWQPSPDASAVWTVQLDLGKDASNGLFGFHVHTNPARGEADLEKTCARCGGHFNPTGQTHGSVLNPDPRRRHAGDLINNVKTDQRGRVRVRFTDDMATLIETASRPYSIIGRSLVVHADTDDLGRQGLFRGGHPPHINGNGCWVPQSGVFTEYASKSPRFAESLRTGNAGARIACGNIVRVVA